MSRFWSFMGDILHSIEIYYFQIINLDVAILLTVAVLALVGMAIAILVPAKQVVRIFAFSQSFVFSLSVLIYFLR